MDSFRDILVYRVLFIPGLRPPALRHFDEGGPEQTILEDVPLPEDLDDRVVPGARHLLVGEGLVDLGIVALPHGVSALEADGFQGEDEVPVDELEPLLQGIGLVGVGPRLLEVVEGRYQGLEERGDGVLGGLLPVALDALLVVLEIGAPPEELVLELVPLRPQRLELRRGGGRDGLEAARLLGLVGVAVSLLAPHGRSSIKASRTARATWSTRAIIRSYSMHV